MGEIGLEPAILALVSFVASSASLGLTDLFERANTHARLSTCLALGWLLIGSATTAAGLAGIVNLALLGPAVCYLVLWGIRNKHAAILRSAALILRARHLHAGLLLASGPILLLSVSIWCRSDGVDEIAVDGIAAEQTIDKQLQPAPDCAVTDCGRSIPLFCCTLASPGDLLSRQDINLSKNAALAVLRTGSPDLGSNCHGWVFASGRYWLRGEFVEQVLTDNGYTETAQPAPGDVVIYRDGNVHIRHSAIVRFVDNGKVLVESKWGALGQYLHAPADQSYSQYWTYYRSRRSGHQLRIEPLSPSEGELTTTTP